MIRPITYNVAPRYTPGSPALVDRATAERVAKEEDESYKLAITGHAGEEAKLRAMEEGRFGIVEERWEERNRMHYRDLLTENRGVREFPSFNPGRREKRALSDDVVNFLGDALRAASKRYAQDAAVMHLEKQTGLAEQLERQAADCIDLSNLITSFGGVTLHTQED